jgi:hypothetical protein
MDLGTKSNFLFLWNQEAYGPLQKIKVRGTSTAEFKKKINAVVMYIPLPVAITMIEQNIVSSAHHGVTDQTRT